ncbi:MAG: YggS family pyridoxal phosphate-dependent enzyme [Vicinamibacterales bacterium]
MFDPAALRARLESVRDRIANAAGRAGRDPSSIILVAVSKTFPPSAIRAASALGQLDFGENKVQEALGKIAETTDVPARWHLIGHLQSNKIKKGAAAFQTIHSVHDVTLVEKLDREAGQLGRTIDLLIQVDLAREATKSGVPEEGVRPVVDAALAASHLRLAGLMVLPPEADDPNDARPWFARLRRLRDDLVSEGVPGTALAHLSMGMSHDFEVAIEEGATIVRVGSAIFGERRTTADAG